MAEWKRICCGLDFSQASRYALDEAVDVAARMDASLDLVHVHQPGPLVPGALLAGPADAQSAEAVELDEVMHGWCEEAEARLGRRVVGHLLQGGVAEELLRFARDNAMQLIVVGTKGRHGLGRLLLGSVAERVVREAPCAVLVSRHRPEGLESDREEAAQYAH
ncbi:MAG: universal stress protein [Anaeromyxobacter sp.]